MMKAPDLKDYNLQFVSLSERFHTDMVVVHHTGNMYDDDMNAEQIHGIHLAQGWSGCGYHYIVRKDGSIEIGRPEWAMGSHAYGENWHTVGVHLCGNFEIASPTEQQIESAAYLIGWICERYNIVPDKKHVVGHRDLMPTACPGEFLYEQLQKIRGKSIWYMQNYQEGD